MTFPSTTIFAQKFARSLPVPVSMIVLVTLMLCALFSYGYSLRTAIHYAVEREDIAESIALVRASITTLDNTYVGLTNHLSIAHARELGFHEVSEPLYISLSPAPAVAARAR